MAKQFSPHVYPEWGELISDLPIEKQAEIFNAILKYPNVDLDNGVWRFIKSQIDKDYKLFQERCKKNGEISRDYWQSKRNRTNPNESERLSGDNRTNPNDILNININSKHKQEFKEIYKESFDKFWKLYPKQRAGSKEKAYSAYCKVIREKRSTPDELIASVEKYAQSEEVKRGFAKGCAAWLNDDRFNSRYDPGTNQQQEEDFMSWLERSV